MTRPSAGSYDCRTRVGVLFAAVVVRTSERDLTPIDGHGQQRNAAAELADEEAAGRVWTSPLRRAILVDFAGRMKMPPVLLRVLIAPRDDLESLSQYVIGARLRSPGDATGANFGESNPVSRRASRFGGYRPIVTWSEHDLRVVKDRCARETYSPFAARYRIAGAFA
jgi:hypothetical protein